MRELYIGVIQVSNLERVPYILSITKINKMHKLSEDSETRN